MPVVDRRDFGGRFSVKENSQRLANYRYLEIQLMEMLGGWSHTTPQLAFKATFGYHVYDHAQAADLLGERPEQLRSGAGRAKAATDDFPRLCEHVWKLDSTIDRLLAVERVLLRRLAAMGQSHIAWGQAVLDSLTQSAEDRRRALQVQAELEGRLVECGGV